MNQAVYLAFLEPGQTILGMDLSHGGHLTHGSPVSHMGRLFNFVRYKTRPTAPSISTLCATRLGLIPAEDRALRLHVVSREYDYAAFRSIADEVGALAMADVSHVAGMIAGGAACPTRSTPASTS